QLGVGTTLEAARHADQFGRGHFFSKRILSGARDLALNFHGRGIDFVEVSVNEDAVRGREKNIADFVARQSFLKIDAQDLELAILRFAKNLRIAQMSVRGGPAREIHSVAQTRGAVGEMISGISHLAVNRYQRRVFKVISPK